MESGIRPLWLIGRRIERLLMGGAALVVLAFLTFFLASAARHYAEDHVSQGIESLALLIEGDAEVLQRFHELETQRRKLAGKKKDAPAENFYAKALEDKVTRAAALSGVDAGALRGLVSVSQPPAELVRALRERKKSLDERPATVAGVMVPSSSLGTRLPAAFLANALIVALAPLMILWLSALRATRRLEKAAMDGDSVPYPHALNSEDLPLEALVFRHLRGRWTPLASPAPRLALLAFVRMALLALLVVPMIGAYVGAVTTLGLGAEGGWLRALYALVVFAIMAAQAAAVVLEEAPARPEAPDAYPLEAREEPHLTEDDTTRGR